jgi:hypothetical protein
MTTTKKPEPKITHEDGIGHNCDVKGCPMCWNDGYNQAIDEMDAYYQPILEKMEEALEFAKGAIEDAIYFEDALGGQPGEAVIKRIDESLALYKGTQ